MLARNELLTDITVDQAIHNTVKYNALTNLPTNHNSRVLNMYCHV